MTIENIKRILKHFEEVESGKYCDSSNPKVNLIRKEDAMENKKRILKKFPELAEKDKKSKKEEKKDDTKL